MQRVADFESPVVVQDPKQEAQFQDETSVRFGILVGGFPRVQWNGIGEHSVGHHMFERRVWSTFDRLRVGIRNEHEGALDSPPLSVTEHWDRNADRLRWKSPRACAMDVLASLKPQGYCVPNVLVGRSDAQKLTEKVWPREIRDSLRLFQHIQYFETFQTADPIEASLASELLEACYIARNFTQEYVRGLKNEAEGEKGLKNLNDELKELFYEINEPLPEQKTALVAQAMGKEIIKGVTPDGRKDDAIVSVLTKIVDRLDRLEQGEVKRGPGRPPKQKETE